MWSQTSVVWRGMLFYHKFLCNQYGTEVGLYCAQNKVSLFDTQTKVNKYSIVEIKYPIKKNSHSLLHAAV